MQRRIHWIAGIVGLGFSLVTLTTQAQALKSGTWTISHTLKSESGKAEKELAAIRERLAKMPQAERQMMENLMRRQGLRLSEKDIVSHSCITPEMAAIPQLPINLLGQACSSITTPAGKHRYKVQVSCAKPASTGEGELIIKSPTEYQMQLALKENPAAPAKNKPARPPEKWDVTFNGKYEDAKCDPSRNFVMPSLPSITQTFAPFLPKKAASKP